MNKTIAFICQPYHRGGVTRWMVDMAVEYAKRNFEVYFITVEPKQRFISAPKAETMIELLNSAGYIGKIISEPVNYLFELSSNTYKAGIYKKLIAKNIPKNTPIVLSDDYAVWQGSCTLATDYKLIAVIHCSVSEFYYNQTKQFINQLSGIVTVSNRCTQKLGEVSIPVLTQPCGIPFEILDTRQKTKDFIETQNSKLKTQNLVLTWAGRLENMQKRVTDLVLIAEKLRKQQIDFLFNIIGEGSGKTEMEVLITNKNLKKYFVFHGWQSKQFINDLLTQTHIYILPSNYEGYPVAVMEALANGCVVVSSRVSGIEDLEKESDTQEVLKVYTIGDVDAAVQHIVELQKQDLAVLKPKAKDLAQKYFSIENCAATYWAFIQNLPANQTTTNATFNVNFIKEQLLATMRYWKYKFLTR
jgi:glycosyltransferase involved in cell wall biosynthesis